jgi:hypothetical protein
MDGGGLYNIVLNCIELNSKEAREKGRKKRNERGTRKAVLEGDRSLRLQE